MGSVFNPDALSDSDILEMQPEKIEKAAESIKNIDTCASFLARTLVAAYRKDPSLTGPTGDIAKTVVKYYESRVGDKDRALGDLIAHVIELCQFEEMETISKFCFMGSTKVKVESVAQSVIPMNVVLVDSEPEVKESASPVDADGFATMEEIRGLLNVDDVKAAVEKAHHSLQFLAKAMVAAYPFDNDMTHLIATMAADDYLDKFKTVNEASKELVSTALKNNYLKDIKNLEEFTDAVMKHCAGADKMRKMLPLPQELQE
jgi:hypothetical protein